MRPSRPLVLVVNDSADVCSDQANTLSRAGYRCVIATDASTALWHAARYRLEPGTPYSFAIVVSPVVLPTAELPDGVTCLRTSAAGDELVDALGRVTVSCS